MAFCLAFASRALRSSLPRQSFLLSPARLLSTESNNDFRQTTNQQNRGDYPTSPDKPRQRYKYYLLSIAAGALIGTLYTIRQSRKYEGLMPEYVANTELLERQAMEARPMPPPVTKHVTFDQPPRQSFPFKVTLYQYVTWYVDPMLCSVLANGILFSSPFCCKVRAYLNYNRIPYDIIEVDSVMRKETKWSIYKKVPIVVIENEYIQLNDSSLIISVIESYLRMPTKALKSVAKLYQPVIEKDEKGKLAFNYPNKYFLVEPLLDERVDPEKTVQTEKSKTDANYVAAAPVPAEKPSNSFLSI